MHGVNGYPTRVFVLVHGFLHGYLSTCTGSYAYEEEVDNLWLQLIKTRLNKTMFAIAIALEVLLQRDPKNAQFD